QRNAQPARRDCFVAWRRLAMTLLLNFLSQKRPGQRSCPGHPEKGNKAGETTEDCRVATQGAAPRKDGYWQIG
ncbi:MAG: hypothetical protein V1797_20325, partial [Pseudomonadota bacterium]